MLRLCDRKRNNDDTSGDVDATQEDTGEDLYKVGGNIEQLDEEDEDITYSSTWPSRRQNKHTTTNNGIYTTRPILSMRDVVHT